MLELRLFDNLDERQQQDAALILRSNTPHKASSALAWLQQPGIVTVAGLKHGAVAAIYGLSPFLRRESGVLKNLGSGYLAARPTGQGIGTEMMRSLGFVFEGLASQAAVSAVEHVVVTRTTLFGRLGYGACGWRPDGSNVFAAAYYPQPHEFAAGQQQIVDKFMSFAHQTWI